MMERRRAPRPVDAAGPRRARRRHAARPPCSPRTRRLRRNAVRALGSGCRRQKPVFRLRRGQRSRSRHAPRRLGEAGRIPHHAGDPDAREKARRGWDQPEPTSGCAKPPACSCSKHKAEATFKEGPNLLPNPGFEITGADGLPEGWVRNDNIGRSGPLNAPSNAKWQMTDAGPQRSQSRDLQSAGNAVSPPCMPRCR